MNGQNLSLCIFFSTLIIVSYWQPLTQIGRKFFIQLMTRYMSLERGSLRPIGILALLKSNYEVDLISHYIESTEL